MNSRVENRDQIATAANGNFFSAGDMQSHLLILAILCAAVILFYFDTFASIVGIWLRSDTFLHGFLIAPISLYLIRENRSSLKQVSPRMCGPAILGLFVLSLTWWVSQALGIQVGEQLIAVAMFPMAVTAVMGIEFSRAIAFPLAYLVFAVPFGEALMPWLMDYTATFTVSALNITGIPVVRDGLYFSTPSGDFEVAKACSGIRYLLATLALGVLYGYLAYQSRVKRLVFLGFSIVLPIVANGIRAYAIVLIAHFSEMQLAVGVDHIIFGWVFFGVVIAVMFAVGNRFRDDLPGPSSRSQSPRQGNTVSLRDSKPRILALSGFAILFLLTGPVLIPNTLGAMAKTRLPELLVPAQLNGWRVSVQTSSDWRPVFVAASVEGFSRYANGADFVDLVIIQYHSQSQDAELVNSQNVIADTDDWLTASTSTVAVALPGDDSAELLSAVVQNRGGKRLIWYWYDINGERTLSNIGVKLLEGKSILTGRGAMSSAIVISAPFVDSSQEADDVLRRFLSAAEREIHQCLHDAAPSIACQAPSQSGVQN